MPSTILKMLAGPGAGQAGGGKVREGGGRREGRAPDLVQLHPLQLAGLRVRPARGEPRKEVRGEILQDKGCVRVYGVERGGLDVQLYIGSGYVHGTSLVALLFLVMPMSSDCTTSGGYFRRA